MSNEGYISIFLRTSINDTGLHYVPGPTLEARQMSDLVLRIALKNLKEKEPLLLNNKMVALILRKHKYPDSMGDLIYFNINTVLGEAYLEFNIPASILDIPVGDYWYDIVIGGEGHPLADPLIRPPMGRFKVVK